MKTKIKSIILITGYSGAGKSTALNVLEDQGYYCIRHLPLRLMHLFLEDEFQKKKPLEKIAIDLDIRDAQVLEEFKKLLHFWKKKIHSIQLIFLKSSEEVLVRRFSETRRRHPFLENGNLTQSIRKEKEILEDLIPLATTVLNTSSMSVHTLKNSLLQHLTPEKTLKLPLSILSFGFKYGIPQSCDLVFDVRFLSNPYFVPKLKPLDGTHPDVQNFVLKQKDSQAFIRELKKLFKFLIPRYMKEGKSYLTIGFGCTGGKHRSVTLAHYFKKYFEGEGLYTSVEDRDRKRQ